MFVKIVIVIGLAWLLQTALGFLQFKDFNKNFKELREKGRVVIGKNRGRVKRGSVILIAIDDNCSIIESRIMKGITILARFKTMEILNNQNLHSINPNILKNLDQQTTLAIQDGIKNYNEYYKAKEEIDSN
ncbi:transcriptional regulator GutM [Clostridium sporogenes]|uniref:Transcriptional regulator n=1 Tax=Clostridium botulinum TaxID=1491 RepID=A0A6M0SUG5_CLOBO|nr:transcriptional regulator GutM [Clostridium sporogenes]EJP6472061.1 transcriptional regulator GutM [Clostridium botulinum]NFA59199.1 transcriptional regulator [Clostridium botulinum]NFI74806.1 transcriptional regulator [Clostridium sporogenes]NFL71061.1 transcriptional regulator [Clostridium sporogenes]NFM24933.1 transcriptional regulator [Clostridium sporogenes]